MATCETRCQLLHCSEWFWMGWLTREGEDDPGLVEGGDEQTLEGSKCDEEETAWGSGAEVQMVCRLEDLEPEHGPGQLNYLQ